MEAFDPATVYSSIDEGGRYAYGNQPVVAEWNLARLAEALLPLFDDDQERAVALAMDTLGGFRPQYSAAWSAGMRGKLGLPAASTRRSLSHWSTSCSPCCRRGASITPGSSAAWARPPTATTSPRAGSSSTWRRSTTGWSGGVRWRRTGT